MVIEEANITDSDPSVLATVILMETQREKDIMLAPDYPYGPLEAGECILNSGILA
jgi:hypothetical protein